jgi:hypothetical protein
MIDGLCSCATSRSTASSAVGTLTIAVHAQRFGQRRDEVQRNGDAGALLVRKLRHWALP